MKMRENSLIVNKIRNRKPHWKFFTTVPIRLSHAKKVGHSYIYKSTFSITHYVREIPELLIKIYILKSEDSNFWLSYDGNMFFEFFFFLYFTSRPTRLIIIWMYRISQYFREQSFKIAHILSNLFQICILKWSEFNQIWLNLPRFYKFLMFSCFVNWITYLRISMFSNVLQ